MHRLRPAAERGHTAIAWLDSRHSFSFGSYRDPQWDGFRGLRVLNDDRITAGSGFGTHPHRDMEIITWVLEGTLRHGDSLANQQLLTRGEVQRMSAGTGITHSEHNGSDSEPARFLQIWLPPDRAGLAPRYDQIRTPVLEQPGRFHPVISADGRAGTLGIHADAALAIGRFAAGAAVDVPLDAQRAAWLQVATGIVHVGDLELQEGDGLALWEVDRLPIRIEREAELLLFDLA